MYFTMDIGTIMNVSQAKCAVGNYKEAEEAFLLIQNEKIRSDYTYISHLARCCKCLMINICNCH